MVKVVEIVRTGDSKNVEKVVKNRMMIMILNKSFYKFKV